MTMTGSSCFTTIQMAIETQKKVPQEMRCIQVELQCQEFTSQIEFMNESIAKAHVQS